MQTFDDYLASLPPEQVPIPLFRDAMRQGWEARNAEVERLKGLVGEDKIQMAKYIKQIAEEAHLLREALKICQQALHEIRLCEFNSMSSRHERIRISNKALATLQGV